MRSVRPFAAGLLKWTVAISLLCGAGYGLSRMRDRGAADSDGASSSAAAAVVSNGSIEFEEEAAERVGIAVEAAKEVQWSPHLVVYGRVVPHARATSEVRATFAGTLRASITSPWP